MAFTEFYVQTTGSNLNSGSTNADAAALTYAGGTFVRSTGVFTVASGDPSADGVVVGDWVSIYTTAGATVATCVALVTARNTTTITIGASPTLAVGAVANVSETAAAATCKVRGAWAGMSGATIFPFAAILNTGINAAGQYPRVNFKSGTTYSVTSAITHTLAGPTTFQGYTTSVGDLGRATFSGGASAINTLSVNASNLTFIDLIFTGGTGSSGAALCQGAECIFLRCVARSCSRMGFNFQASGFLIECEAYSCNSDNNANAGGFGGGGNCTYLRCIAHDNNGFGFALGANSTGHAIQCIADTNTTDGFIYSGTGTAFITNCDSYNNTSDGIDISAASAVAIYIENCNFTKNGGYGINSSGAIIRQGAIVNCGFGAGTQANTSGDIAANAVPFIEIGTVNYASNTSPYNAPTTGDFDLTLATALSAGRGSFTQTQASYTGTIGVPCIGASQPTGTQSGGGGGGGSYVFGG